MFFYYKKFDYFYDAEFYGEEDEGMYNENVIIEREMYDKFGINVSNILETIFHKYQFVKIFKKIGIADLEKIYTKRILGISVLNVGISILNSDLSKLFDKGVNLLKKNTKIISLKEKIVYTFKCLKTYAKFDQHYNYLFIILYQHSLSNFTVQLGKVIYNIRKYKKYGQCVPVKFVINDKIYNYFFNYRCKRCCTVSNDIRYKYFFNYKCKRCTVSTVSNVDLKQYNAECAIEKSIEHNKKYLQIKTIDSISSFKIPYVILKEIKNYL